MAWPDILMSSFSTVGRATLCRYCIYGCSAAVVKPDNPRYLADVIISMVSKLGCHREVFVLALAWSSAFLEGTSGAAGSNAADVRRLSRAQPCRHDVARSASLSSIPCPPPSSPFSC